MEKMINQVKKLPCPFRNMKKEAGHELYICREETVQGLPRVGCTCGARGPLACGDDNSVIEAWNTYAEELRKVRRESIEECSNKLIPLYKPLGFGTHNEGVEASISEIRNLLEEK